MKDRGDIEIPEHLKPLLRKQMLNSLQDSTSFDCYELELFDWYIEETEALLDAMLQKEHAYLQEQIQSGREEVNDSGMVAIDYFLKRVRYSHVLYLASLVETSLKESCTTLAKAIGQQNMPFKLEDLSGDKWTVKRKFLENYGGFSIPEEKWKPIHDLTTLRNNLAHENGNTCALSRQEKNRLSKHKGIGLNGYEIEIEKTYIRDALQASKALVQFVDEKIAFVIDKAISPKPLKKG